MNAPLDFELKELDPHHPYLKERGFTDETIAHFGLGCSTRGLMKNRVAIPLHDAQGQLVGYAGRLTKDEEVSERNPKYLFPGTRERKGTMLEFHKSLFLYHGWQFRERLDDLIVVEGFPAVWWLWQHGYHDVVALMGSECSAEQAELIVSMTNPAGRVWVFPDADPAGERCAIGVFGRVGPHRPVRWVKPSIGQPTDFDASGLAKLLWPQ